MKEWMTFKSLVHFDEIQQFELKDSISCKMEGKNLHPFIKWM